MTISLDTDWIWRVLLFRAGNYLYNVIGALGRSVESAVRTGATGLFSRMQERRGGLLGAFSRSQPIAATALWIAVLLTGYVLTYFF